MLLRRRGTARLIDEAGKVNCPLRSHDVDVENCWGCDFVVKLETDCAGRAMVHCDPPVPAMEREAAWI